MATSEITIQKRKLGNQDRHYEDRRKLRRYEQDGLPSEPMHGSDSFADCWFVMSICSPSTMPLLPRLLLDYAPEVF